MRVKYVSALFVGLLILLSGCRYNSQIDKRKLTLNFPLQITAPNFSITPPITIFIHGTKLIRNPQFHTIFNGTPNLIQINTINPAEDSYKRVATLCESSPREYAFDHCYLFGWSGKLSSTERRKVAHVLHTEIKSVVKKYKKEYKCNPIINIIAHSHGSNLALNLGSFAHQKETNYTINSLVLLACPVQTETIPYINSPLFKNIYALYSSLDVVQIIAPQMVRHTYLDKQGTMQSEKYYIPRLSSRKFPPHKKLIQTRIKINNHAIGHKSFFDYRFLRVLPHIITELDIWKSNAINLAMQSQEKVLRVHVKKNRRLL